MKSEYCPLKKYRNVTLLGARAHRQLPCYSQHWDVSLLPFIDSPMVRACNPMKLREYLAAGRPIVSTPIPAILPYRHLLDSVEDADAMVRAMQRSLQSADNSKLQRESVIEHTWAARANQLSGWLENL